MQCMSCGGHLEWAGGGANARCTRCLSLFSQENQRLTPIVVEAPGGGYNPDFNALFAQNLGFGPPPPGAQAVPPPQQMQQHPGMQPQPSHNVGAGTFDMGGGQQLHVKIDGRSPDAFVKHKVSGMIWGWIIGAIILAVIVLGGIGLGIYIYFQAKDGGASASDPKTLTAVAWDGKTPYVCSGNQAVMLSNVNATAGVTASGNCQLTLKAVNITAPVGITASANAKVIVNGGIINGSDATVMASGNAKVDLIGTKVMGRSKATGGAKISGP